MGEVMGPPVLKATGVGILENARPFRDGFVNEYHFNFLYHVRDICECEELVKVAVSQYLDDYYVGYLIYGICSIKPMGAAIFLHPKSTSDAIALRRWGRRQESGNSESGYFVMPFVFINPREECNG